MTHRSWCAENEGSESNERLEFLGDSVLGLVVTKHIFVTYQHLSEGKLAKLRAEVVSAVCLADVARGLDRLLEQGYSPSDIIAALVSLVEASRSPAPPRSDAESRDSPRP